MRTWGRKLSRYELLDQQRSEAYERNRWPKRMTGEELKEHNERVLRGSVPGYAHRRAQIEAIVAEQGERQRNGACPMPVGSYGATSKGRKPKQELVIVDLPDMLEVIPQKRKGAQNVNDGGPDLVDRWIADVDRRWDAKMRRR